MIRLSFLGKFGRVSKGSLIGLLAVMMVVTAGINAQKRTYNPWNVADNDTIYFRSAAFPSPVLPVTGVIFKAIDPKYLAYKHGFSIIDDVDYRHNPPLKPTFKKWFTLVAFSSNLLDENIKDVITSFTAQKKWNYYINDQLLVDEARALVSALMPQTFERTEFNPTDTLDKLAISLAYLPLNTSMAEFMAATISHGSIRFYTRSISKSTINDKKTVYLLNDGQVITRKIYEAINPVFIRSLIRITDQEEIKKYGLHKGVNEIVKLDFFKRHEVINVATSRDCPECDIYIVDNIQVDWHVFSVLDKLCFKEVSFIFNGEESFVPFRGKFPSELNTKKTYAVTIITL